MIERLLDGIFWIGTVFTRSRHPEVEEFRHQQRVLIVASVVAVGCMLLALLFAPSESGPSGAYGAYTPLVTTVLQPFVLGLAGISVLAGLVAGWAAYHLSKYDSGFE